ncbi:hypothetical protein [Mycobacterium pseudokansasii]|uniref:hypothetical protein n=1 Tax=Mycobacterium pseudokansasii TaxID=2341080 RepID=UPI0007B520A5|nr:hypothetical protein [Mycobacterium pseudokansasii]KZS61222.1 hypothetical protein A4G27_24330 [Mycobacterium kansasii]VAZ93340.1 hypothetical protein LAUMK35_02273 [Mycobacterium pseudokansasii]VAZ94352.1 hypothetical protein LAUMK21_02273 [Mycobacterium pseudokansasii]
MTGEPKLSALTDRELDALASEFVILAHIWDHPKLAGWGRRQAWLVMAEIARRCGTDPGGPTPEIIQLADLPTSEQKALRDLFEGLAELDEIEDPERPFARWLRAMHRRIGAAVEARQREADQPESPLRRWIAERRRERPHGTPGDTTGLPPWPEIGNPTSWA